MTATGRESIRAARPSLAWKTVTLEVVAVALLAGVVRISSYHVPLERNTAQTLYGADVLLHGGTPYVDAAVNKGPLAYPMFAVIRLIVGRSEVAVRLSLLVFAIAGAMALGAYLQRVADPRTGMLGGVIFSLLSAIAVFGGADPDIRQYAVAPMALAMWLASQDSSRTAATSGAMTAAVGLLSPDLLIPLAPAVLLTLWRARAGALDRCIAALLAAVAIVVAVGIWLLLAGALPSLLDQVPGTSGAPRVLPSFGQLFEVPGKGLWLAGIGATLIALSQPRLRMTAVVTLVWIALSWARVKLGDPLTGDLQIDAHYYPALVGLSAGLALGIGAVWTARPRLGAAFAGLLIIPLVVGFVVLPERDALQRPTALRGAQGYPWGDAYPLAAYIDSHTRSDDRIYVTGSQPEVYWLADRLSPTRFFDIYPIFAHPAYDSERIATLYRHPPVAIVAMPGYGVDRSLAGLMRDARYQLAYSSNAGQIWLKPR